MPRRKAREAQPEPAPGPAKAKVRLVRRYEFFTQFIDEFADAVSAAGMFVRAETPSPPGTEVEFEFKLGEEIVLLAGRGVVEWVGGKDDAGGGGEEAPGAAPEGMAIRFEKLGTGSGKVIRRLTEANAQRGGAPFRIGGDEMEVPESGSYEVAELLDGAARAQEGAPEALKKALREAEASRQELARRRAELAEARSGLDELTARLQASERELGAARAAQADDERELEKVRGELGEARRELKALQGARAEVERGKEETGRLGAALAERSGELERLRRRFEVKSENEKSLTEEVSKLKTARDELRSDLDAKEAELAWLRGQMPEGGEAVPPEAAERGLALEETAGIVAGLKRELAEARETIAAIQQEALRAGREARPPIVASRRRLPAFLGAAALAIGGAAIGALAVWQLRSSPPTAAEAVETAALGPPDEAAPALGAVGPEARPQDPSPPPAPDAAAAAASASPPAASPAAQPAPAPPSEPAAAAGPGPAAAPDPLDAVRAWAAAWSAQRVDDYLAAYSPDFEPPRGTARGDWEAQRRERLQRPRFIRVQVEAPQVEALGSGRARVRFRQIYESESYGDRVDKTLELALEGGRWRITAERAE